MLSGGKTTGRTSRNMILFPEDFGKAALLSSIFMVDSPRLETEAWAADQRTLRFGHSERQWHLVQVSGQNGNLQSPD